MRIALISFIADRSSTGMGKWSHEVASALRRRGHSVELWFDDQFPGVKRLGRRSGVLLAPLDLARRLIARRATLDVVVVHEPLGVWCGLLRRLGGRSLPAMVCMCHNVESHHAEEMQAAARLGLAQVSLASRLKGRVFRRWQSDGTIRLADAVVCLSSSDARYIAEVLGVPTRKIFRLVNGAEPAPAQAVHRDPRKVLFVGGWLDVKGRRLLPSIVHSVVEAFPDVHFTLVGTGVDSAGVLEAFDETTRRHITVLPSVHSAEEMSRLYALHSMLLMPSVSEGSPLTLIEAMSSGLGVVASNVGGISDVVTDGVNGKLFDPRNPEEGALAVVTLLREPTEAAQLGAAARGAAASLTWDRTAEQLEAAMRVATGTAGPTVAA